MIDYIPPDIPPAIIKYADEHFKKPEKATGRWFKYLTIWKGNLEVYITDWKYKKEYNPKTGHPIEHVTGLPYVLIYDCHDVRRPTLEETRDIHFFIPAYSAKNLRIEHLCHSDLEAFNQYETPNPYKQKPKYVTPKYIPKHVVKYVDEKYPVSWYPWTYVRHIKYLTTYKNKYEAYIVFWTNPKTKKQSLGKYILYDCENVREFKDEKERIDLTILKSNQYKSTSIPNFCKRK